MDWKSLKFRSPVWDKIKYVEDTTSERIGSFKVRKYTFERFGKKRAFAEGHTRLADNWAMLYLSTLSGCPVGCKMCGTKGKFAAQLSAEQMIKQIDVMIEELGIDAESRYEELLIKWMYMGEPMLNSSEFTSALRYIFAKYPNWNHVVSTIGPRANYDELFEIAKEYGDKIEFTISIHGLSDTERDEIIPFRRKFGLEDLIAIGEKWFAITGKKVSFSYNLSNSKNMDAEAKQMREMFNPNIWVPCIQYMHTVNANKAYLENRKHSELCDEADARVDTFLNILRQQGYEDVQGYYTNRDELKRGCGSLVEYQKFAEKL